jgi:hypothetical protein
VIRTRLAGKNLLFVELIIVIGFFSVAAAACVTMFGQAYKDSNDSRDLTNAVIMAQNAAEIYKATGELSAASGDGLWQRYVVADSEVHFLIYKDADVIYEITVPSGIVPAIVLGRNGGVVYED